MKFIESFKNVIYDPNIFFKKLNKRKDFSEAFRFYFYAYLVITVFMAIYMRIIIQVDSLYQTIEFYSWLLSLNIVLSIVILYVFMLVWLIIALFITTGISHLFFMAVKAKGKYKDTFNAYSYSLVPTYFFLPVSSLLSIGVILAQTNNSFFGVMTLNIVHVVILAGMVIWLVRLQLKAFSKVHSISRLRAAVALYFIPIVIYLIAKIIYCGCMFCECYWKAGLLMPYFI
ncbi:MAG: YIP1 family protein [archaeon]